MKWWHLAVGAVIAYIVLRPRSADESTFTWPTTSAANGAPLALELGTYDKLKILLQRKYATSNATSYEDLANNLDYCDYVDVRVDDTGVINVVCNPPNKEKVRLIAQFPNVDALYAALSPYEQQMVFGR